MSWRCWSTSVGQTSSRAYWRASDVEQGRGLLPVPDRSYPVLPGTFPAAPPGGHGGGSSLRRARCAASHGDNLLRPGRSSGQAYRFGYHQGGWRDADLRLPEPASSQAPGDRPRRHRADNARHHIDVAGQHHRATGHGGRRERAGAGPHLLGIRPGRAGHLRCGERRQRPQAAEKGIREAEGRGGGSRRGASRSGLGRLRDVRGLPLL